MWRIAGVTLAVILLSVQCANATAAADDDDDADNVRDSASRPQLLSRAAVERVPLQFERYGSPINPHYPPLGL